MDYFIGSPFYVVLGDDQTCQIADDCDATLCKDGFYICYLEKCVCIPNLPKVITCNTDDDCAKSCPNCGCTSAKCDKGRCYFMC